MLIRNAEWRGATGVDVRCGRGVVEAIAARLEPRAGEVEIDARGGVLLPALHDHHLHFLSLAAALASTACGPPQIRTAEELRATLVAAAGRLGGQEQWIRGVGYHASVAGDIDRYWLDACVATHPVRIQHRSGRLWVFNSAALRWLGESCGGPLERQDGGYTGRLYDADDWLRDRLDAGLPDVGEASRRLASCGVVAFTDTTPSNSLATAECFASLQQRGALLQDVVLMGDASLDALTRSGPLRRGALKIHLHESELPELERMHASIARSHAVARPVAVHCVTLTELVFTVSAFAHVGVIPGDRIEHAAIAPPETARAMAELGLRVVTQPHFIAERGDHYAREVDAADMPWLYRLQGLADAGIRIAAGTDAPFGNYDPWRAMQAAVSRRTRDGILLGAREAMLPEAALALFHGNPMLPGEPSAELTLGAPADLLLLDRSWRAARECLSDARVRVALKNGLIIWHA